MSLERGDSSRVDQTCLWRSNPIGSSPAPWGVRHTFACSHVVTLTSTPPSLTQTSTPPSLKPVSRLLGRRHTSTRDKNHVLAQNSTPPSLQHPPIQVEPPLHCHPSSIHPYDSRLDMQEPSTSTESAHHSALACFSSFMRAANWLRAIARPIIFSSSSMKMTGEEKAMTNIQSLKVNGTIENICAQNGT